MAYVASLVSLGSAGASSSWNLDFKRVYLPGNLGSFRRTLVGRIRRYVAICRYSVSTDLAEKETLNLLDFKTAHEPILMSNPTLNMNTGNSFPWDYKNSKDEEEERNKVFESLGDALEKVEKLEASQTAGLSFTKPSTNTTNDYSNGKPVNSTFCRKSKSGMSVWRRGNSVTRVQNVVKYSPKIEKVEKLEASQTAGLSFTKSSTNTSNDYSNGKPVNSTVFRKSKSAMSVWRRGNSVTRVQNVVKESPKIEKALYHETISEVVAKVDCEPVSPPRPLQSPVKVQPRLQGKPSVTPPPTVIRKPLILKDVRATSELPTTDGIDSVSKTKERKPILIDKYASNRPVVDPSIARALSPTKPKLVKGLVSGKFRADFQKKIDPTSGPQKRIFNNVEFSDKATKLEISIPGVSTKRKGRKWSKASRREARLQAAREADPVKVEILEVAEGGMFIEELAHNLAIRESEIFWYIYNRGIRLDGARKIDRGMVKMICKVYDVEVIDASPHRVEEMARKKEILDEDDLDKLEDRPPVITVMGHVDHGKTTLLDYIRKSKVAVSEVGGITQGIGAYKVLLPIDAKLQPCVFLDTPGHEAFGAMRARGTRVTDIAIIVVAADDGICPQTNEAIAHAKAAGVPIVIAINKIDKDGANPERVMQELASIGLMPEDWGGDVPVVQISALKGEKVDDLLETVMLVAELEELKANPHRCAKGTVIEAGLHKSKGPVGTFIVQNGTLRRGDMVVCGEAFGKVRALFDEKGNRVDEAGPSIPVQVIGISTVPIAGDEFEVVGSLNVAREKAKARAESLRIEHITANADDRKVTLSSLASAVLSRKQSGLDLHELNIVMKADVQGSIEAVRQALLILPQDNVALQFLLQATGDISTSDVDLAIISKAIIMGFNVKTPLSVKSYARNKGIEIRMYRVIYDLIDDVRKAMEGLLDLVEEQVKIGSAEVRAVFSSGRGRIAGCIVTEGKVLKDCGLGVVRSGKTVYVGILNSLRRVKEQVKEVKSGLECGIGMDNFLDWKEGDILEAFNTVQKKRTLEDASATMAAAIKEVEIKR